MLKKRISCAFLAFCMLITMSMPVSAAANAKTASEAATALHTLGLFQGKGEGADGAPVFALGDQASRAEAVTMLVRLLGREGEAEKGVWSTPFTDVPDWALPYVGYAYENGLTRGQEATLFGSGDTVLSNDYLTLLLRALGYTDSDFTWATSRSFAASIGLGLFGDQTALTRGDVARASLNALYLAQEGGEETLLKSLVGRGAVMQDAVSAAGLTEALTAGNGLPGVTTTNIPSSGAAAPGELSATEVFARCSPAVFYIEVYDAQGNALGSGSGFFISADGKAVTNYHVIEDASSAKVLLSDGETIYNVKGVYDYDAGLDVALLQVDGSGFSYLTPATDTLASGQTVYAIGSPLGLANSISQGIVSSVSRVIDGTTYIQTSAAISAGSSGGALLNTRGEVIGVTAAGYDGGQNLNFAVPYAAVQALRGTSLRTLPEVLREVRSGTPASGAFSVSPETVKIKAGSTATVTLRQSYPSASTVGYNVANPRVASLRWGNWSTDGESLTVTVSGRSVGSTTIQFYLYGKNNAVLAQTEMHVEVTE